MKKTTKYILAISLFTLPIVPALKPSSLVADNKPIPFLKQTQKNPSLRELITHLKFMNNAQANSSLTAHSTNNLRNSIGLAIGFSDNTSYGELACGGSIPAANTDCNNAPPYNGIVGRLTDVINTLPAIGESVGITNCSQVPSSGSAVGRDSDGNTVTINFTTPTHTVPSPWLKGGTTFEKRVEFSYTIIGESTKLAYEFNCGDDPAAYIAINMDMGTLNTYPYIRRITVYTGPMSSTRNGIEVYMAEYNSSSQRLRASDAIRIEYLPATSEYYLWGIMNTNINGGQLVARSVVHGNYSTNKATFLSTGYQGNTLAGNDGAIDITTVNAAGAFATATDLTNGTGAVPTFDFAADLTNNSGEIYKSGCVDFSSPDAAPANTNACAGLPLVATSVAPYADATGDFSIQWTLATMPNKLEVLP